MEKKRIYVIMYAKGRVKWPDTHMPSLLEHMCVWTFDERMRPRILCILESEAFEALPATCRAAPGSGKEVK